MVRDIRDRKGGYMRMIWDGLGSSEKLDIKVNL